MHSQVIAHPERAELLITDPIENARFALYTDATVTPHETNPEEFYFPVDAAVTVKTSGVEIPKLGNVFVRTQTGGRSSPTTQTALTCTSRRTVTCSN